MLNCKRDHTYLEARCKERFAEKNFASLIASTPFLATWDDHDLGLNDSRGGEIADWKRRRSRRLFHRCMDGAVANNRPEVYCSYELDDIKIIMLDVGYYRERISRRKPAATPLRAKPDAWLWRELDHSKRYTMIGAGSCIEDGAEREIWANCKPLNNYGIMKFGHDTVTVSLRGRRSRDSIGRRIRSSNWTLDDQEIRGSSRCFLAMGKLRLTGRRPNPGDNA